MVRSAHSGPKLDASGHLTMSKLTPLSKILILLIVAGAAGAAYYTRRGQLSSGGSDGEGAKPLTAPAPPERAGGKVIAALSEWPGHMALVVGNGGLRTTPGSAAAAEGLDLQIVFIEDAAKKNQALQQGAVDFVWQTVDELPISMGSYRAAGAEAKAFVQIDWS